MQGIFSFIEIYVCCLISTELNYTGQQAWQELDKDSPSRPINVEKKAFLWMACQVNKTWGTGTELEFSPYSQLREGPLCVVQTTQSLKRQRVLTTGSLAECGRAQFCGLEAIC